MPLPSDMESGTGLNDAPLPQAEEDELAWGDVPTIRDPGKPIKRHEPRTVEAGFAEFCERLVPKYSESEAAVSTLQTIEKCLRRKFNLAFVAPYGSRGHGTNVQGFSAIDNFAVMPSEELYENAGKSLKKVHDAISTALPGAFITDGRPVVAVPFGERPSERHHIVPAYYAGERDGHDLFAIPAPRDRWIKACPAAHSIWINELDRKLSNDLKSFIRIVKAWSYFNGDVVWRYYLEHCVADYLKHDRKIVYSRDLCSFFGYLANRELAPFENTVGSSDPVYGTSIAGRDAAMATIHATLKMAKKALACEQKDNVADAFYWWRKIFDWRFAAF